MKALSLKLLLIFLVAAVCFEASAATISGNISYTGPLAGEILVVAFTDSTFRSSYKGFVQMDSPGSYTMSGLADGTYYIISIMNTDSMDDIKLTDPWGVYGTLGNLTPVTITQGVNVSGINITLVDGTTEDPNPFYRVYISPSQTIQLPETTRAGDNSAIAADGSSIYLYKHDYSGAASAKIFKINPSSGDVIETYILSLQSLPYKISWIDYMIFHKGGIWVTGGYGDPSGSGWVKGIFKIDIGTSSSSNMIPADTAIDLEGGFASDGVNFYVGVDSANMQRIVKFDPDLVSKVPTSQWIGLDQRLKRLCYGAENLWAGIDSVRKMDPVNGTTVARYNIPPSAAELYFNGLLWLYDRNSNTLNAFSVTSVGVAQGMNTLPPSSFSLSQNYPNPFNPSTSISFKLSVSSFVSLKIFDVTGREIATIISEEMPAGSYTKQWNVSDMPSGVYFYRLQAGKFTETKKLVILK